MTESKNNDWYGLSGIRPPQMPIIPEKYGRGVGGANGVAISLPVARPTPNTKIIAYPIHLVWANARKPLRILIVSQKYGRGGRCLWPNQPQNHCLSNTSGMGECQKAPTGINYFR
ncbi:hypothetical protein AFK68_29185 [Hydrocoleum sp. CS-953]|uniref:hypothetical protein n=1 Tax=Hydrocoleum sp. CS-953 TaxID=1671698 RepID=UPI000B9A83DD|nr:hypothetical protein [Hydrocoleum sp. CS-953]OZH51710.1 hypothetical protein AFK68_29185 [Hydrocoleum sp. CS-953]